MLHGEPSRKPYPAAAKSNRPIIKHSFKSVDLFLLPSPASSDSSFDDSSPPSTPSSAVVIGHNEQLITHILLGLPPNSLLRFQSVSKLWRSIIGEPNFPLLHSRGYRSTPAGLLLFPLARPRRLRVFNFVAFRQDEVNSMAKIVSQLNALEYGEVSAVHSCNGLLAIVFGLQCQEFMVYNPTTRKSKLIPMVGPKYQFKYLNIVFDPKQSDHYKLVCVWYDDLGSVFSVYSSKNGVWRNAGEVHSPDLIYEKGVLWNGDLHWICPLNYSACFDLRNECIRRPVEYTICTSEPKSEEYRDDWYFGESGGHLFYIHASQPLAMVYEVFEMELVRDHLCWNFKYHFDLTPLSTLYPQMIEKDFDGMAEKPCAFYITHFLVDDKEKKSLLVISLPDKFISCDFNNLTLMELADVEVVGDKDMYSWPSAFLHGETLAHVDLPTLEHD